MFLYRFVRRRRRQAITWTNDDLLSHPGIPGVTLCFCTGSYAAAKPLPEPMMTY